MNPTARLRQHPCASFALVALAMLAAYAAGRTPNPDVACNRLVMGPRSHLA